ncbi:MAG: glutamate-1-semialdehyde 2,1-aminomutase [Chitinophagales bacterium]|nr:glutamate-1-semialdehyde 2,1-aminomutase [Bacteroidota bacterium]MCB9043824.1 glutamate-1-semialdehyde 2,1-aminomutase [Chitinophagales bacterium]
MQFKKSEALYKEAVRYIPAGVNSPVRAFKAVGGNPIYMEKGEGAYLWDADGNQYIDFCASWGPLILGHNAPEIVAAATEALAKGATFGTVNHYEVALAQLVVENHRFIEKIRFVSSGTEAVMSAVRLARGFTQRDKIIKFEGCYHGHVDYLLVKAGSGLATFGESSSAGVPQSFAEQTLVLPLNDAETFEKTLAAHGNEIAAVLIEPIPANNGLLLQDRQFLQLLRDKCNEYGILLIFDEVISGFRVGFEGAAGLYNITPDICTFGKIIGGGFPVGAFGARAEIMDMLAPLGAVYQAGTLSGNPVAMAAGAACLRKCLQNDFYIQLAAKTTHFVQQINDFTAKNKFPLHLVQMGSIFWLNFSDASQEAHAASDIATEKINYFKPLFHHLLAHGVYIGPSAYEVGFVSAAHTPEILATAADAFCKSIALSFG